MFGPLNKRPRLGQWNGRTRSSRCDEPILPRLCRRPVLLRLAAVWLTTLAVTAIAYAWGPPLPYRVGETCPHDLRVRVDFEIVNPVELVNLKEARRTLENNAQRVPGTAEGGKPDAQWAAIERYSAGMLLIQRGQPITDRQLALLQEEHAAYTRSLSRTDRVLRGVGLFLVFGLLSSLVVLYVIRFQTSLA